MKHIFSVYRFIQLSVVSDLELTNISVSIINLQDSTLKRSAVYIQYTI